ncbi:hypothetical protein D3C79_871430 [compost metagenome]
MGFAELGFQRFDAAPLLHVGNDGFDRRRFAGLGQLLAQLEQTLGQGPLLTPQGFHDVLLSLSFSQAGFQRVQHLLVNRQTGLGIAAQRLTLTAALGQLATQAFQALRRCRQADPHPGTGGVEDIHRLVWQLTPSQVTG